MDEAENFFYSLSTVIRTHSFAMSDSSLITSTVCHQQLVLLFHSGAGDVRALSPWRYRRVRVNPFRNI